MRKHIPNLLIFCGSGRNIGKTALSRCIISHTKDLFPVAAVKISPHFHDNMNLETLIWSEEHCNIYQEKELTSKDSSMFLQSGADPVFYIETKDHKLEAAFTKIIELIGEEKLIVCESGMLARYVKPAVLIYIESAENTPENNKKFTNRDIADIIINVENGKLSEELLQINKKIIASEGKWALVK